MKSFTFQIPQMQSFCDRAMTNTNKHIKSRFIIDILEWCELDLELGVQVVFFFNCIVSTFLAFTLSSLYDLADLSARDWLIQDQYFKGTELNLCCYEWLIGWVGLRRTGATLVGYCQRSGIHPEGWSGDMPSQFWSTPEGMSPPLMELWITRSGHIHKKVKSQL